MSAASLEQLPALELWQGEGCHRANAGNVSVDTAWVRLGRDLCTEYPDVGKMPFEISQQVASCVAWVYKEMLLALDCCGFYSDQTVSSLSECGAYSDKGILWNW